MGRAENFYVVGNMQAISRIMLDVLVKDKARHSKNHRIENNSSNNINYNDIWVLRWDLGNETTKQASDKQHHYEELRFVLMKHPCDQQIQYLVVNENHIMQTNINISL